MDTLEYQEAPQRIKYLKEPKVQHFDSCNNEAGNNKLTEKELTEKVDGFVSL